MTNQVHPWRCIWFYDSLLTLSPEVNPFWTCLMFFRQYSSAHDILSKPRAAFPHNHCWNNRQQWERNESCCNDCHQSSESVLAEPEVRTDDLILKSSMLPNDLQELVLPSSLWNNLTKRTVFFIFMFKGMKLCCYTIIELLSAIIDSQLLTCQKFGQNKIESICRRHINFTWNDKFSH